MRVSFSEEVLKEATEDGKDNKFPLQKKKSELSAYEKDGEFFFHPSLFLCCTTLYRLEEEKTIGMCRALYLS